MLLAYTRDHYEALERMAADLGCCAGSLLLLPDISTAPDYLVRGLKDVELNWNGISSGEKKIIPFSETGRNRILSAVSTARKAVFSTRGMTVERWTKPKTYRPVLLPPPVMQTDDPSCACVPAGAVSALTRTVPAGKVATGGRIKGVLKFIYMFYYDLDDINTEMYWKGYDRAGGNFLYSLQCHRIVDNRGIVNGNGMSRGCEDIDMCRLDAGLLQAEGVVTCEDKGVCYVRNLERYEYDFSDLFIGITAGKAI